MLAVTGAGGFLVLHLSGLLAYETARVWLFMVPLAIVPAAALLARLAPWVQWLFLGSLFLTAVVYQGTFVFLYKVPPV